MLSVNQMFYGADEPVWLVEGSSSAPVKYHYLGAAHRSYSPPRRFRDPYYESQVSEPYYHSSHRMDYSSPPSRRSPSGYYAPPPVMAYSSINPPPAPLVVPRETAITHTPVVPLTSSAVAPNTPYTLLLKVPICCEGCENRIVKKMLKVPGVMSVICDIDRQRVTVRGTADTDEVLRAAKKAFKKSRLW